MIANIIFMSIRIRIKKTKPTRISRASNVSGPRISPSRKPQAFPALKCEPGTYDSVKASRHLQNKGYVLLPVFANYGKLYPEMIKEIEKMLLSFPEYKRHPTDPTKTPDGQDIKYVQGGFSALGNPASFHHPLVRLLREWVFSCAYPALKEFDKLIPGGPRNLEYLMDRFMSRPKGSQITADHWHRDTSKDSLDGDDIFGGWINLDNKNQCYSANPENYVQGKNKGKGFEMPSKAEKAEAIKNKRRIVIPPGNLLIFFQNGLHEIVATKFSHHMYRMFTAFRLTHGTTPMYKGSAGKKMKIGRAHV